MRSCAVNFSYTKEVAMLSPLKLDQQSSFEYLTPSRPLVVDQVEFA